MLPVIYAAFAECLAGVPQRQSLYMALNSHLGSSALYQLPEGLVFDLTAVGSSVEKSQVTFSVQAGLSQIAQSDCWYSATS